MAIEETTSWEELQSGCGLIFAIAATHQSDVAQESCCCPEGSEILVDFV